MAAVPKRGGQDDNVESVDMEMASSEEEAEEEVTKSRAEVIKSDAAKPAVSFSLTPNSKHLNKSPLVEKEEVKAKKPLLPLPKQLNLSTPPPKLLEPPPLPNVDEIFPELNSSGEGGDDEREENRVLSSPLLPPPMPPQMMGMGQSKPIPQLNPGFSPNRFPPNQFSPNQRPPRPFFNNRGGNNQRPRFPPRPNTPGNHMPPNPGNSPMRPMNPGMRTPVVSPRFRPDNFRGRPPWFGRGGNQRPPHFAGGW